MKTHLKLLDGRARWVLYLIVALGLFSLSAFSNAADAPFSVLNGIDDKFRPFQNTWYKAIRVFADGLFWKLVLVDFMWTAATILMEKNAIEEIVWSLVKKIFSIGFFFSLLKFSNTWIPGIIDSLRGIGQTVGNTTATPDGVVYKGYEVALGLIGTIKTLGMVDTAVMGLPIFFCALVIFLAFLFVAAVLLITLVETYLAVGAGVILLGFGGSRWTADFATKYLQFAFGTGMKLMVIYLVIGVGQTMVADMQIDTGHLFESMLVMIGTSFIYAYLVVQIPAIVSGMMSGSPALSAGGLATTALTMGAAAFAVGSAGKSALGGTASAATSGAAGAGGLVKALGAGLDTASDLGLTGAAGAVHAAGNVAGTGVALAAGGIGSSIGATFGKQVASSAGGQIADKINANRGGSLSGVAPPASASTPSAAASTPSAAASTPSAAAEPKPSTAPASAPSAPASAPMTAPGGDASTASISGGGGDTSSAQQTPSTPANSQKLHEKIRDLQGFVPQEHGAAASAIQINMGHLKD